jgi:hypothetical protein
MPRLGGSASRGFGASGGFPGGRGSAVAILDYAAQERVMAQYLYEHAGVPTDGTNGTYAHVALPGALLIDTDAKTLYQNTGTQASPTWTERGAASVGGSTFYVSGPLLASGVSSSGAVECDLFAGLLAQSGTFAASGSGDLTLPQAGVYEALVTMIASNPDGTACPYTIGSTVAADLNYDDDIVVTLPPSAATLSITVLTTMTATAGQTVGLSIAQGAGGHTSQDVTLRLLMRYLGPASV